jgi:hypothetical protein
MRILREWIHRVWGPLRPGRRDRDLEQELRLHLELVAEDARRQGHRPEDAARIARIQAGGISQAMDALRDQRGSPLLESVWRDARLGLRTMRRSRGFTFAVVASLGLGIAATLVIFSVADAVLFRSLPYAEPSRLATVSIDSSISAPLFETFREQAGSLEQAGLFDAFRFDLSGLGEPERVAGARVSPEIFEMVGAAPLLGRVFAASEDRPGRETVVILGHHCGEGALQLTRASSDERSR